MSFPKEVRKKVFQFFEKLLFETNKPTYYENLRGHVSKAEPSVREYVRRTCKGEDLLNYFKKRKNYFDTDFRGDVSLKKSRYKFLSLNSYKTNEIYESNYNSAEEYDNEYSVVSDCSRSVSVTSSYKTPLSSVDGEDSYNLDTNRQERTESEIIAIEYFKKLLGRKKNINISTIQIKNLPNKVQQCIAKYLKGEILLFFKNYPKIFLIDDNNFVSLLNPLLLENISHENILLNETPACEINETLDEDKEILKKFVQCAEFFVSLVKKKKNVPLNNLSGRLSQAPSDVKQYLLNYTSFKHFLLDADKLFILNENEEVSLIKDYSKLLKHVKQISDLKSVNTERISPFQPNHAISRTPETGGVKSYSEVHKLGMPNVDFSNEDVFYSTEDIFHRTEDTVNGYENSESSHNRNSQELKLYSDKNIDIGHSSEKIQDRFVLEGSDVGTQIIPLNNCNEKPQNILDSGEQNYLDNINKESENPLKCNILDTVKKDTQRNFIKCVFIAQLLCLEIIEKKYNLCLNFEYEAVKFFVDILKWLPGQSSEFNSLKGSLGQAPSDVKHFVKQLYKGEKIKQFFLKHDEFDLKSNSSLIKLSSSYENSFEEKRKLYQAVTDGEKVYSVSNLYNSHLHEIFTDVFDCLSKICCFLQNKQKIKFSRWNGIFSKFSTPQQEFINSLNGSVVSEKFKEFLCSFIIFDVSDEFIQINPELDVLLLINSMCKFNEKLNMLKQSDKSKLPCFDHLVDCLKEYKDDDIILETDDISNDVIKLVQDFLSQWPALNYSQLPKIVGHEILHSLVSKKENSQSIIKLLEDNTLFDLKKGQIFLKVENLTEAEVVNENNSNQSDFESESQQQLDLKSTESISDSCNDSMGSKHSKVSSVGENSLEKEIEGINLDSKNDSMSCITSKNNCTATNQPSILSTVTSSMSNDCNSRMDSVVHNKLQICSSENNTTGTLFESLTSDLNTNISCDITSNSIDGENVNFLNINQSTKLAAELDEELDKSISHAHTVSEVNADVECLEELLCRETDEEIQGPESFSSLKNSVVRSHGTLQEWLCNVENSHSEQNEELNDAGVSHKESLSSKRDFEIEENKEIHRPESFSSLKNSVVRSHGTLEESLCGVENSYSTQNEELNDEGISHKESLSSERDFEIEENKENYFSHKTTEFYVNDLEISKWRNGGFLNTFSGFLQDNLEKGDLSFMIGTEKSKMNRAFKISDSVQESLKVRNFFQKFRKFSEKSSAELKTVQNEMKNSKIIEVTKPKVSKGTSFEKKNVGNQKDKKMSDTLSTFKQSTCHSSLSENIIVHKSIEGNVNSSSTLLEVAACSGDFLNGHKNDDEYLKSKIPLIEDNLYASHQSICSENVNNSADIVKGKNSTKQQTISSCKVQSIYQEEHANEIDAFIFEVSKQNSENELKDKLESNLDSFSENQNLSESSKSEDYDEESHARRNIQSQNSNDVVLQPLQAKIILVTVDSCIVETVIEGHKKCIFCLKSSFHCDRHDYCIDCFDALVVGDAVSCYIPPSENLNCGNMCFAFMFCKDGKEPHFQFLFPNKLDREKIIPKTLVTKENFPNQDCKQKLNNCESYINKNPKPAGFAIGECQTDLSGEVKNCSHLVEKECQVSCPIASQVYPTVQSPKKKISGVDKGCQIQCSTVTHNTQTCDKSCENGCQTILTGEIKPCHPVVEKECLVKFPTFSQTTQTVCNLSEIICQTDITGSIRPCFDTSSCECQTILTGKVQKSVSVVNKSCQVLPSGNLVHQTTQTVGCDEGSLNSSAVDSYSSDDNTVSHSNYFFTGRENFSEMHDVACQTIATGAIMIKTYIVDCV